MASTCAPGIARSSRSVASKVPKAFWWQWPWTRIACGAGFRHGSVARPSASSAARYWAAGRAAGGPGGGFPAGGPREPRQALHALIAREHRRVFVAKGEEAGGLEA